MHHHLLTLMSWSEGVACGGQLLAAQACWDEPLVSLDKIHLYRNWWRSSRTPRHLRRLQCFPNGHHLHLIQPRGGETPLARRSRVLGRRGLAGSQRRTLAESSEFSSLVSCELSFSSPSHCFSCKTVRSRRKRKSHRELVSINWTKEWKADSIRRGCTTTYFCSLASLSLFLSLLACFLLTLMGIWQQTNKTKHKLALVLRKKQRKQEEVTS